MFKNIGKGVNISLMETMTMGQKAPRTFIYITFIIYKIL